MTILNLQVGAGNADAHERESGANFDGTGNQVSIESDTTTARFNGGYLFTNVTVPKDAQIISAVVQVYTTAPNDDANLDIHAEAVDDAADFVATADVTSRARSATSIAWVVDGLGTGFTTSPSIKTVIQEHVDRAGWASGNDLVILFIAKSDVSGKWLQTTSYESTPARAAKLDITYAVTRKRSYARTIL